jgi:hypothetical protein
VRRKWIPGVLLALVIAVSVVVTLWRSPCGEACEPVGASISKAGKETEVPEVKDITPPATVQDRGEEEEPPPVYVPVSTFPTLPVTGADAAMLRTLRWVLSGVGVLLGLLTLAWLWRRGRQSLYLQGVRSDELLEDHVLRDRAGEAPIVGVAQVGQVSRMLRQRVAGTREELDLARSLDATMRAGGALTARYRRVHQTPEYLALVERVSANDHQAVFHGVLIEALRGLGVTVDRYYFEGSPAAGCWRPVRDRDDPSGRGPAQSLASLAARYHGHRLLVFGDTACAVDRATGEAAKWTANRKAFPQRAWFSTVPVAAWGEGEGLADRLGFLVVPALPEALGTFAEWLATDRATLRATRDWPGPLPPVLAGSAAEWVARQAAPSGDHQESLITALRDYLGPLRFQWLCACAVFPVLAWPLTLALGRTVLSRRGEPLAPAALAGGVASMAALPWFRHGRMPDWLRMALLDRVAPAQEARLREVIETRLTAAMEQGAGPELVKVSVRKRLGAWLARRGTTASDVVLAGFLEKGVVERLAQSIPEPLRRLLFRDGRPAFGLRRGLVATASAAAALSALGLLPPVWDAWTRAAGFRDEYEAASYASLAAHTAAVRAIAFSPDGRYVATGSDDGTALVWSTAGNRPPIRLRGHRGRVTQVVFSSDGALVVTGADDSTARVWAVDGRGEMAVLRVGAPVTALLSPRSGDGVAVGTKDGVTQGWGLEMHNGKLEVDTAVQFVGGPDPITYIALNPDGSALATMSRGGSVRVWVQGTRDTLVQRALRDTAGANYVGFAASGRVVTVPRRPGVPFWNITGTPRRITVPGNAAAIRFVAFAPDSQTVVVGTGDESPRLLRPDSGGASVVLRGHTGPVTSIAFSPDGQRVVTASEDGTIRLWGAPPAIPVNIVGCNSPHEFPATHIARWLASLRARGTGALFSPAVIERFTWDTTRLGKIPPPGTIYYDSRNPRERAALDLIRASLDTRPPPEWASGRPVPGRERPMTVRSCVTVWLYYKNSRDIPLALAVSDRLRRAGYQVRYAGLRSNAQNTDTEPIRYFHPEDAPLARLVRDVVQDTLRRAGVQRFPVAPLPIADRRRDPDRGTPERVEVWLPWLTGRYPAAPR